MISRILVFGYYGCGNLGDETNLRQLLDWIREIEPEIQLTVISARPEQTVRDHQVVSIGKFNLFGIVRALRQTDRLIGGSGNLFQDLSSLRSLLYYSALIILAGIYRVKVFLYSQGVGPVRSATGRQITKWAMSQVQLITIRDRFSQYILEGLKVSKPKIYLTADPLFDREPLPAEEVRRYWNDLNNSQKPKVGLIIREYRFINRRLWNLLLEPLPAASAEYYLLAIQDNDLQLIRELAGRFRIKALPVPKDWWTLQQAVGGFDLVISARFHGLVAARVQGIHCLGLAADLKIEAFCREHEIEYFHLDPKTEPLLLYNQIMAHLRQPVRRTKPFRFPLNIWKARALENKTILRKVIKGDL